MSHIWNMHVKNLGSSLPKEPGPKTAYFWTLIDNIATWLWISSLNKTRYRQSQTVLETTKCPLRSEYHEFYENRTVISTQPPVTLFPWHSCCCHVNNKVNYLLEILVIMLPTKSTNGHHRSSSHKTRSISVDKTGDVSTLAVKIGRLESHSICVSHDRFCQTITVGWWKRYHSPVIGFVKHLTS